MDSQEFDFDNMSQEELEAFSDAWEETNSEWLEKARTAFRILQKADKTVVVNPLKAAKADIVYGLLKEYYSKDDASDYEITTTSAVPIVNSFSINVRAGGWGNVGDRVIEIVKLCDEFYVHAQDSPTKVWVEFVFTDFYSIFYES